MTVLPAEHRRCRGRRGPGRATRRGDGKAATGFMAPSMLGLLAFTAFPIVASLSWLLQLARDRQSHLHRFEELSDLADEH